MQMEKWNSDNEDFNIAPLIGEVLRETEKGYYKEKFKNWIIKILATGDNLKYKDLWLSMVEDGYSVKPELKEIYDTLYKQLYKLDGWDIS